MLNPAFRSIGQLRCQLAFTVGSPNTCIPPSPLVRSPLLLASWFNVAFIDGIDSFYDVYRAIYNPLSLVSWGQQVQVQSPLKQGRKGSFAMQWYLWCGMEWCIKSQHLHRFNMRCPRLTVLIGCSQLSTFDKFVYLTYEVRTFSKETPVWMEQNHC